MTTPEPIPQPISILLTIKKMLGLDSAYEVFDTEIIVHINSVLMSISQIGVGPADGFSITGASETWTDLLGTSKNLAAVKSLVYLKVKSLFDPPTSSFVLESLNNQASEIVWRLNVQAEPRSQPTALPDPDLEFDL